MSRLTLHVNNFRAISNAEIELDGITVLSGVNSAGKSTLSKLLYYVAKLTLEYEKDTTKNLINEVRNILWNLSRISNEFLTETDDNQANIADRAYTSWINRARGADLEDLLTLFSSLLNDIEKSFLRRETHAPFSKQELTRFSSVFGLDTSQASNSPTSVQSISKLFGYIRDKVNDLFEKASDEIRKRPLQTLQRRLEHYLKAKNIPVSLYEEDTPILDFKTNRVNNLFSVQQVFYSDTPMAISNISRTSFILEDTNTQHWQFLKQTMWETPPSILKDKQIQAVKEIADIINGNVSLKESDYERRFNYNRTSDGLTIDLAESATGIKSFAILQLLLSEGLLTENTLFIIDEPEAHLHPQWIVEYARILVLLNKRLGVKFMLASHNPDMVSALRYISEKEEILNNTRFYLAEKVQGTEQFSYRNLRDDIEPIFESFNIALDRINQYGI